MTEQEIQARTMLDVGAHPAVRLFRNNTGQAWQGDLTKLARGRVMLDNARPVSFGLCVGSSDLIGWRSVVITPADVGRTVALFVALEAKTATGRPTPDQTRFLDAVTRAGGMAGVFRKLEDAREIICI